MIDVNDKIQRYDAYKDSGVEWLGNVPEHWEVWPGFTVLAESKQKNTGFIEDTVLSLSYGNVIIKPKEKLTGLVPESFETYQLVRPGDIIIRPTDLQNDKTSLRTGLAKDNGIITSAYINLRVNKKNNYAYYHYYLYTIDINKVIYGLGSGLRQNISFWDFKRFPFPLPSLQEQTKIAQFLDDKTIKIEAAIAIKEQQINLLKERKQILIHKAVTQGLNPKVKLKDSGVEWIGEIPEHWEVKKVTHLFDRIGSGTTPTSGDNRYYDGKFNFLQTGDLNDNKILRTKRTLKERAFKEFSSLKIYPKGSLVMAMYGATIGKLGILNIESATNQACCVFGKSDKIRTQYFFQVLLAFRTEIISFGYGGGQPNISQDLIKSLRFPIAPLSEQKEISAYIETASQKIETAIGLKEQEIDKLKEYKSSLINSVVTGKVKVC
jgi:type I restriction enzyme S subunit